MRWIPACDRIGVVAGAEGADEPLRLRHEDHQRRSAVARPGGAPARLLERAAQALEEPVVSVGAFVERSTKADERVALLVGQAARDAYGHANPVIAATAAPQKEHAVTTAEPGHPPTAAPAELDLGGLLPGVRRHRYPPRPEPPRPSRLPKLS